MNGGAKYEKIENQNGVDEYCGNGDLEMTSMQRRVGNGHVTNSLGSDSKICEYWSITDCVKNYTIEFYEKVQIVPYFN